MQALHTEMTAIQFVDPTLLAKLIPPTNYSIGFVAQKLAVQCQHFQELTQKAPIANVCS